MATVGATTGIVNSTNLVDGKIESTSSDKDMFLKLMIAQMQNQDPLNPQDGTEYVSQLATFTTLEQMQQLNSSQSQSQAYAMIGKYVVGKYEDADGNYTYTEGRVEGVTVSAGTTYVTVGDYKIALDNVEEVYEDYSVVESINDNTTSGLEDLGSIINSSQALGLVGQTVQAIITDSDGNALEFLEGQVTSVKFADGSPVLMVNGVEVYPSEVISVAQENLMLGKEISVATEDADGNISYSESTITGITFTDNVPYVNLANGEKVKVSKINHITEANQLLGEDVTLGSVTGTATDVVIKNSNIYVKVGDELLLYTDIRDKYVTTDDDSEDTTTTE
ncbi:MAG: flagellar hook assembly protein FlgD [Coprobacillaceae bacterium]